MNKLTTVNLLLPPPVLWTYFVQSTEEGKQMTWVLFQDVINRVEWWEKTTKIVFIIRIITVAIY